MAIAFCGKRVILTRNSFFKTLKRRNGYIILLPEIGEDLPEKNPLLKEDGLPEFNTFTIEKSMAAIGQQTVLFEQGIAKIENDIKEAEKLDIVTQVLHPLEDLSIPLETTWGVTKALYFGNQSLMPTKYYLNIHNRMIRARATKFTSLPIYKALKEAFASKVPLTPEQKRLIQKYLLEGRLNGLDLTEKQTEDLQHSIFHLHKKTTEMLKKVEIATSMFKTTVSDPTVMKDFPEDFLRQISVDSKNPRTGPWKITLEPRIYSQFMENCPDRELRWNVWQAYVGRCALHMENTLRTSGNLEDIRDHRKNQAKVLGYRCYAEMSMVTKTAGSLETVYSVLSRLLETARPAQEQELQELTTFAHDRGFDGDLLWWDVDYWSKKHRRTVYNYKDEVLCEYFPLPQVLKGLFGLIEELFDVRIVEGRKTDVWHTDVRFFDVIDLKGSAEPIAHFYLDPYAREKHKMNLEEGGWMVGMQSASKIMMTKPLAALVFNFPTPYADVPSLLSVKDVVKLFEKVGTALQHMLTTVSYGEIAGLANVEWDSVGVSGHFMANWCYEPRVIKKISSHYRTGEALGEEHVDSIRKIRSQMAGFMLSKEIYLSRCDLELHESEDFWPKIQKRLWEEHFVIPHDSDDSQITAWSSIFCHNLGAAYYSDLWSQMIAADVYSAFLETKGDKEAVRETANRFRETFLSLGGSVPAGEVFRRFRGRDPNSKALLKNLGLQSKDPRE
ncbi:probable cytosolic oligopeptidase A [Fopius arisanus]|uniref:Probable cytosolic oligopeptidase A n=1 Tax=Fopius arisanus TaxID=64838 RepID=A0A9R1THM1_9HYME|nr:PREDICTED: probable cytosolic oligopeptidase A [Fopius arisanus]